MQVCLRLSDTLLDEMNQEARSAEHEELIENLCNLKGSIASFVAKHMISQVVLIYLHNTFWSPTSEEASYYHLIAWPTSPRFSLNFPVPMLSRLHGRLLCHQSLKALRQTKQRWAHSANSLEPWISEASEAVASTERHSWEMFTAWGAELGLSRHRWCW